jgi:hypothetical protein
MSFWSKVGVNLEDLECFRRACEKNQIEFNQTPTTATFRGETVVAELRDKVGGSQAFVVRSKGALRLVLDTDAHYSTITQRLGENGGKLGQDYAREVICKETINAGGMLVSENRDASGWLTVRTAAR